ncbi:UNVERIFIED_CONTAM: Cytochrome c oxidase subunit [Sesamum calycinum]|uniref:Cytochrome c oxidase subunit 3 n=1 Tax=Sesamum calycinum TaxID=2727403 RepID=A0AAW2JTY1_9LAMI
MIESQRHSYHLVDPSPWPISGSLGALATTVGGVMYMHSFQGGATLLSLGLIFILYTMFVWWRDVLRESTLEGHHTKVVQLGPRYGFILFIVSEVMFFFAFFRASSHSSLAPTVEIGGIWPPKGIGVLDPWEIPFLNTLIPPSSGAAVTWAHHAILAGKEKRAVYALVATVLLALVFTGFQGMEYYQAPSTISDSIYGSTFFLATGFHGFHVIIEPNGSNFHFRVTGSPGGVTLTQRALRSRPLILYGEPIDHSGPSNAGPSNVAPTDSPRGSFPSVPSSLTPIPSDPSSQKRICPQLRQFTFEHRQPKRYAMLSRFRRSRNVPRHLLVRGILFDGFDASGSLRMPENNDSFAIPDFIPSQEQVMGLGTILVDPFRASNQTSTRPFSEQSW